MSTDAIIFGVVIVVLLWLIYSQLKEILKALIENTETVAQWGDEITAALKPPLTDDELIDEEERKRQNQDEAAELGGSIKSLRLLK